MKTRPDWYEHGKLLPYDSSTKVEHCSTDKSAHLTNTRKGVRLYCHRCKEREFEPHEDRTLAEIIAANKQQTDAAREAYAPASLLGPQEWPAQARVFVLRSGLTPEVAASEYGFGWHEKAQRLCMPIPSGALYRAVFGERPKYVLARGSDQVVAVGSGPTAAITEDYLSAIKVSRAGGKGIAVLGTSLQFKHLAIIADAIGSRSTVVWTDPDRAGEDARRGIHKRLGQVGIEARDVRSARDPKYHSLQEIKELLCLT